MSSRAAFSLYCGRVSFPNEAATTFAERVKSSVPVGRRKEEGGRRENEQGRGAKEEGRRKKEDVGRRRRSVGSCRVDFNSDVVHPLIHIID